MSSKWSASSAKGRWKETWILNEQRSRPLHVSVAERSFAFLAKCKVQVFLSTAAESAYVRCKHVWAGNVRQEKWSVGLTPPCQPLQFVCLELKFRCVWMSVISSVWSQRAPSKLLPLERVGSHYLPNLDTWRCSVPLSFHSNSFKRATVCFPWCLSTMWSRQPRKYILRVLRVPYFKRQKRFHMTNHFQRLKTRANRKTSIWVRCKEDPDVFVVIRRITLLYLQDVGAESFGQSMLQLDTKTFLNHWILSLSDWILVDSGVKEVEAPHVRHSTLKKDLALPGNTWRSFTSVSSQTVWSKLLLLARLGHWKPKSEMRNQESHALRKPVFCF